MDERSVILRPVESEYADGRGQELQAFGRVGGVVTEPLPPQIRTCAYSRIRFLT